MAEIGLLHQAHYDALIFAGKGNPYLGHVFFFISQTRHPLYIEKIHSRDRTFLFLQKSEHHSVPNPLSLRNPDYSIMLI